MAITVESQFNYFLLLVLCSISTIFLVAISRKFNKSSRTREARVSLPPSPPSLPIIGHLHLLSSNLNKSFQQLSSKYGSLLFLRFGFYKSVLVSSAPLAAEIFKANDLALSGKPISPFEDRFLFGNCAFVTAQYGEYWKFMKKLCVTQLLGNQQVLKFRGTRREEITRLLLRIVDKASKNEVVDLRGEFMDLSNTTICRMANMGSRHVEGGDKEAKMRQKLVLDALEVAVKINLGNAFGPFKGVVFWMYGKQVQDVMTRLDVLLEEIMREHEERVASKSIGNVLEDGDMVDILLQVHRDEKAEFRISRNQIKAFILDIFMAGTTTTSDTMQFVMGELINHPDVYKKVTEEIESVVGKNRLVEESDIPNLHYLHAVVKETLRMYPPLALIPRACMEKCKVGGFDILQGTSILINAYGIMRDPDLWENPDQFHPERFLNSPEDQNGFLDYMKETVRSNFSFLPFGGGRRTCPGSSLALTMITYTIAAVVQCFDWQVMTGGGKVNMEMKGDSILTTMLHPLMCFPHVHFNPFQEMGGGG